MSRTRTPKPPVLIARPVAPPDFVPVGEVADPGAIAIAVLAGAEDGWLLGPGAAELADRLAEGPGELDLADLAEQAGASSSAGSLRSLPLPGRTVHLVGVGGGTADELRRAGAELARACAGTEEIVSFVQAVADEEALTAFVAGATLASFRFSMRTSEPTGTGADRSDPVRRVLLAGAELDQAVLDRAVAIARASWEARRLATVPSNVKSPRWLADQVIAAAERAGLETRLWESAELERDGFGGILAVGAGSATPPHLVQLDYVPPKGRRAPRVVLVGKGITFDSGGLSIKPAEGMTTMKRDMTGAAVVAATMTALAEVGCPVRVSALLPMAENAVGGSSMRPGDVIRHRGGRTSEVTNTDAEGRLVLADALQYAVDELNPAVLVDVATLTGAMKVALGTSTGGFFATDDALADAIAVASASSGERVWRMPLVEDYEQFLASKVADADNAPGRAGAITAALFLRHFTGGRPWAHLDIASVGDSATDTAEWTPGPTGFGVRLLLHWLGSSAPIEGIAR